MLAYGMKQLESNVPSGSIDRTGAVLPRLYDRHFAIRDAPGKYLYHSNILTQLSL